ncbi:hypothetical protein NEF87_001398 [Candidatus Lokiarchaeum ossiferum]|uniref:SRPBCC family protein n=1 Tax=Candidatus Lokiarchaeum ossiferum TaxID=2951803 RepID=A0ABY6HNM8_9ARCH|nr:hypothetical protein NEF87_001398 [Candidatus Lokiarchaeum sp. B-35]
MASNSSASKPLLSVVDEIQNQVLANYADKIFETEFWKPLIPIKAKMFEKLNTTGFQFEIDDDIILDSSGLLKRHFFAKGTIHVEEKENIVSNGKIWDVEISLNEPLAIVKVRIRARDIVEKKKLKIGIFIQTMDFDNNLLDGVGRDAILFAIRFYIRKAIQIAAKIN